PGHAGATPSCLPSHGPRPRSGVDSPCGSNMSMGIHAPSPTRQVMWHGQGRLLAELQRPHTCAGSSSRPPWREDDPGLHGGRGRRQYSLSTAVVVVFLKAATGASSKSPICPQLTTVTVL